MIPTLLALLTPLASAAEPIVVPDFSFDTNESFALSVMLHAELVDRLLADGHIVLSQGVVAREVGGAAIDRCLENPACPRDVLPRVPSQVALLGMVSRQGGAILAHVELWEQSRPTAIDVRDIQVLPGKEHLFVEEVAQATAQLLGRLPPSSTETLMAAARMIAGQPAGQFPQPASGSPALVPLPSPQPIQPAPQPTYPAPQPTYPSPQPTYPVQPMPTGPIQPAPTGAIQPYLPQPQPVPAPYVAPQPAPQPGPVAILDLDGNDRKPARTPKPDANRGPTPARAGGARVDYGESDLRAALEGTGLKGRHIAGAEQSLRNSGLDPRDWLYKATPHGGRLIVEPHIGIGIGDTDRRADVRVEIIDGVKTDEWFQEGPLRGSRVRGALFVGYAPLAYLDIGVLAGLQYGRRQFTTGYHQNTDGNLADRESELADVAAAQFVIQPRLRAYVLPTGPLKPFLLVGGDFRMFDSYQVAQPADIQYPVPFGGTVPGFVGGGGLMVDPSPIVGVFVEGTYIRHFGSRAGPAQTKVWQHPHPDPQPAAGSTIGVVGGLQFRL